jgi:hypothetical protein
MKSPENERPVPRGNAGSRADSEVERDPNRASVGESKPAAARGLASRRPQDALRVGVAIEFAAINRAALAAFPAVLARILPNGKRVGAELVALNPRRNDRHLGSFKINRYNGRWADFATGDKGGDPISLVAYLADLPQGEAARLLARMLGIEGRQRHG